MILFFIMKKVNASRQAYFNVSAKTSTSVVLDCACWWKYSFWTAIKQIFNHSAETSLCVYSHESGNWSMQLYIMFSPGDMFISVFIKPTYFPFRSFCDTVPCVYIVWICECIECAVNVYILRKCASIGYDWLSLYWADFFAVSCGLSVAASLSIKHAQVLRYLLIENTSGSRDMFPTS